MQLGAELVQIGTKRSPIGNDPKNEEISSKDCIRLAINSLGWGFELIFSHF